MHIPARPRQAPILTGRGQPQGSAGPEARELAAALRQRLDPERWPVPPEALPAGTALVGGAVRDGLLGRLAEKPDLDLVVPADAIALARRLARERRGSCVVLDAERDIARLVLQGWTVDLARREGPDLITDLQRRDYSANAIALPLEPGAALLDPTGGLAALAAGQLVAVRERNLLDDPLRLLRGVRLAWELELELEATSLGWIRRHARQLRTVAGERVLAELERLAQAAAGEQGLEQALELGLLQPWGADPQAAAALRQLNREAAVARGLSESDCAEQLPLARLAALLPAEAVAQLKGSRRLLRGCERLRHWWQRLETGLAGADGLAALTEEERLQLQRELEAMLPALLLRLPPAEARALLERWRNPEDPLCHPQPPLNGDALRQALQLPAGPQLGALLQHLTLERAFGRLEGSGADARSQALAAARLWLERAG